MTTLRVDRPYRGQVLRLTLNAPPGNRLDEQMVDELLTALEPAAAETALKLIAFQAEGPDFSVSARLLTAAALERFHQVFYRLIDLGVPTAAVVRGRCLSAGLELAAFCNFIFAGPAATFGQPEIRRGGFPRPASLILPLKLGQGGATDLVLGGATLDVTEAYRRGLVTAWAQSHHDLDDLSKAWIESHLLPKSARSLRRANRLARLGFHTRLRAELPALEAVYVRDLIAPTHVPAPAGAARITA